MVLITRVQGVGVGPILHYQCRGGGSRYRGPLRLQPTEGSPIKGVGVNRGLGYQCAWGSGGVWTRSPLLFALRPFTFNPFGYSKEYPLGKGSQPLVLTLGSLPDSGWDGRNSGRSRFPRVLNHGWSYGGKETVGARREEGQCRSMERSWEDPPRLTRPSTPLRSGGGAGRGVNGCRGPGHLLSTSARCHVRRPSRRAGEGSAGPLGAPPALVPSSFLRCPPPRERRATGGSGGPSGPTTRGGGGERSVSMCFVTAGPALSAATRGRGRSFALSLPSLSGTSGPASTGGVTPVLRSTGPGRPT